MNLPTIDIMKHTTFFKSVDYGENDINNFFVEYINNSDWEEHSFYIFDKYADSNKIMIDIGGWIGATPIYCSYHFKEVVAFEIDKVALKRFKNNLKANPDIKNCTIIEKAIGKFNGTAYLNTKGVFGDSESTICELENVKNSVEVDVITFKTAFEKYIPKNSLIGLIKIDIEGSEKDVIPNMTYWLSEYKPPLYLSLHHHLMSEKEMNRILEILFYIYPSRKIWDKFGNYVEISKHQIIEQEINDCVFCN